MNQKLNQQVTNLEISGIRQFFNRVQQYPEAVQLTLGQPDFPTPEHIKTAAAEAIVNNETTYTANAGTIELRKAASAWAEKRYNLTYMADSEIIVTVGASQAIDVTMRTILEPGDEVIVPAPAYPAYEPIIKQCGAEVIFVDTRKSGFKLTKEQLLKHITKKTKAVMLPYPSNPTGVVLSEYELRELHSVLEQEEVFVVADEIYSELRYNGKHESIASLPNMKEKTIVINGLSKSHSMTGWRIGFLFAHESVARHLLKVHQYNVSCASSISQAAALAALTSGLTDPVNMRTIYNRRRVWLVKQLQDASIPAVVPEGAFYIFPDISKSGLSSYEFSLKLLSEEKLAVVPGNAFSSFGEGYIRLSYAYSMSELEEAVKRLIRFWRKIGGES
ncbi:aminotransferase A [Alkalicoccus halolimnae]|uniref:Aminotransferase n=1 Tax=Alkalicoccus halolimnae TaxID=1667239 RepID=A0A5C7FIN0_9BACI|nr:aminotransferase A [Alkalicoccus halolimnae]TXF87177.1 aminotransferase A [Alkalicoccus halolimnae]